MQNAIVLGTLIICQASNQRTDELLHTDGTYFPTNFLDGTQESVNGWDWMFVAIGELCGILVSIQLGIHMIKNHQSYEYVLTAYSLTVLIVYRCWILYYAYQTMFHLSVIAKCLLTLTSCFLIVLYLCISMVKLQDFREFYYHAIFVACFPGLILAYCYAYDGFNVFYGIILLPDLMFNSVKLCFKIHQQYFEWRYYLFILISIVQPVLTSLIYVDLFVMAKYKFIEFLIYFCLSIVIVATQLVMIWKRRPQPQVRFTIRAPLANDEDDDTSETTDYIGQKVSSVEVQLSQINDQRQSLQDDECIICLQQLIDPSHNMFQLRCNHSFHKSCLKKWSKVKNRCPLCKRKLGNADFHDLYAEL